MSELLRQAALDAGLIDLDCLRLVPFSRETPAEQIARFKQQKPGLFYNAPTPDARKMSPTDYKAALADLQRTEARRQSDAAHARTMERLQADRAAADAARDLRATQRREREAEEHRRLSERHRQQRGG